MAQTLEHLITEANSVFPDSSRLTHYQQVPTSLCPVELLAQYLVTELRELYDPKCSDGANLSRIITDLDMASVKIEQVSKCFRDLREGLPS